MSEIFTAAVEAIKKAQDETVRLQADIKAAERELNQLRATKGEMTSELGAVAKELAAERRTLNAIRMQKRDAVADIQNEVSSVTASAQEQKRVVLAQASKDAANIVADAHRRLQELLGESTAAAEHLRDLQRSISDAQSTLTTLKQAAKELADKAHDFAAS